MCEIPTHKFFWLAHCAKTGDQIFFLGPMARKKEIKRYRGRERERGGGGGGGVEAVGEEEGEKRDSERRGTRREGGEG